MSKISKFMKNKHLLPPHSVAWGEGTLTPHSLEVAQLKLQYISTTLSVHKMDTGSTSTVLPFFQLFFFFLPPWHTQKVVALAGSNGLKAARMHSRYPSTSQLGGCLFVTTGCCKSKFNPVAAGSSKANIFEEPSVLCRGICEKLSQTTLRKS